MSYRLDLDEHAEIYLLEELVKRMHARKEGLCDYCGQSVLASQCKMHWRHRESYFPGDGIEERYDDAIMALKGLLP